MNFTVVPLWQTPLWLGHLDQDDTTRQLARMHTGADPLDITHLRNSTKLLAEVEDTAATIASASGPLGWTHRLHRWLPGHQVGYNFNAAAIWAIVVLDSTPPPDHPQSGEIRLHDPRAGAGNVALPGLPWGRPVTIPAVTGAVVAAPGWLPYTVAPVRPGHTVTVWTLLGHQNSTQT